MIPKKYTLILPLAIIAQVGYSQVNYNSRPQSGKANPPKDIIYQKPASQKHSSETTLKIESPANEKPSKDKINNNKNNDRNSYYYYCRKCGNEKSDPTSGQCPAGGYHDWKRVLN